MDIENYIPEKYKYFFKSIHQQNLGLWKWFSPGERYEIPAENDTYLAIAELQDYMLLLVNKSETEKRILVAVSDEQEIYELEGELRTFFEDTTIAYEESQPPEWLRISILVFEFAARLFSAALLLFFAYAPAYLGFKFLMGLFETPTLSNSPALLVAGILFSLAYFFLLIAWRAVTGKGRKQDGGLMPPLAMKFFVSSFGIMAVLIVFMGIAEGKLIAVLGGIGYIVTSLKVMQMLKRREENSRNKTSG